MTHAIHIQVLRQAEILAQLPLWNAFWCRRAPVALSQHPIWLAVLEKGLNQQAYLLRAVQNDETVGLLPLSFVESRLFGKFLVSLPYLNTAGVITEDPSVAKALIDQAVVLAEKLDVRYLELRHESPIEHPAFNAELKSKVHMRLPLPDSTAELWDQFSPKVRNQIRKAETHSLHVQWGSESECLNSFYSIFSRNMRDLGTPVYPRGFFAAILNQFGAEAELCVVSQDRRPIASALLLHGQGITEVPSASSLREFNSTNANMLMYWHLLQRAIQREQQTFDFGRSSEDSNTYRFKKQWGASPVPAHWQYHTRRGEIGSMRPDTARNQRLIHLWRRLPVWLTRQLGPIIVRGIP